MKNAAFVLLLLCFSAQADPVFPDLKARVDAVFQDIDTESEPGCVAGVIQDGRYIHKAGYGLANLDHGIPLDATSVFRIGSVSKQFTAASVAILAVQGQLDLDADVHTFLPDLVEYGHEVTLRHMIHHVAGMGDYDHPVFREADGSHFRFGNEDYWTIEEFYERVAAADLIHAPGQRFEYSNLGYFLLGQVVERVSGVSLRDFAQREIFTPLGMKSTFFNDDVNQVVPRRAYGYQRRDDGEFETFMTNLNWVGEGGVFTSLDDFLHWDQNFYRNRLGAADKGLIEMITTPKANVFEWVDGLMQPVSYAFGLEWDRVHGEAVIGHGGSWVGFTALYQRFPELALSVVVFCNSTHVSAYDRGEAVGAAAVAYVRRNRSGR